MPMSPTRPRLVFMGTPDLGRVILKALAAEPAWEIPLVVAQPDKPAGRGLDLRPPPVKLAAAEASIPLVQPASVRDARFLDLLRSVSPDVIVVAAYGQLLPQALLEIPARGCLNVHTSILPRWRGAAPIPRALLEGDTETGVTIMKMDAGLDTGDILTAETTPITDFDTAGSLHDRLADLGARALIRILPAWIGGRIEPVPQPGIGVTYARKLSREDGRIDWSESPVPIWRRIRGLNPSPGAWTRLPEAEGSILLKIWEAEPSSGLGTPGQVLIAAGDHLLIACGDGALRLLTLQREGRRRMGAREFLAGSALRAGALLNSGAQTLLS